MGFFIPKIFPFSSSNSRYINNTFEVIADGFNPPLTGINYLEGNVIDRKVYMKP